MKYMGSKNRIAKFILPIMLKERVSEDQYWVEPFVGGANMIDKVIGDRIGSDLDIDLISMWNELKKGWHPPEHVSFEEYSDMRTHKLDDKYPNHLLGFVKFGCSYAGRGWSGGYARNVKASEPNSDELSRTTRNYCSESKRNILKQLPNVIDVEFIHSSYNELKIPNNSIIYCDPPYADTKKYNSRGFNHEEFWQWCREKKLEGHTIFISEYSAPDDFNCIWEKEVNSSLTKDTGSKKAIEKLFTI